MRRIIAIPGAGFQVLERWCRGKKGDNYLTASREKTRWGVKGVCVGGRVWCHHVTRLMSGFCGLPAVTTPSCASLEGYMRRGVGGSLQLEG